MSGRIPFLFSIKVLLATVLCLRTTVSFAQDIPAGLDGYRAQVRPFFETYCIKCHGPAKSKGKIALHALEGDLSAGEDLQRWELILEVIRGRKMPPEDEAIPEDAKRRAVAQWIETGLRDYVAKANAAAPAAISRRLTNFEYQNTMRDLFGFELNLVSNLPEDPVKPYHFNNSAKFMLIGPEQLDRYRENARRILASAIVDPGPPKTHRTEHVVKSTGPPERGMRGDEIGVYNGIVSFGIKGWPATGEFRVRIKAAAILPKEEVEVPLRVAMGTSLRSDAGTGQIAAVGTAFIRNDVDHVKEFEFRGRIENIPVEAGQATAKGQQPPKMMIHLQNLFDNGELNDHRASAFDSSWNLAAPRAVVQSVEFDAPLTDVWPPEHHRRIVFDSPLRQSNPEAYVRELIAKFASRAFRRPVEEAELDRFVKIHKILAADSDSFEQALRETLAMVLISPQFLYRTNPKEGVSNRHDQFASKLSYFLWGSMPDDELLGLAAKGAFDDPRVVEAQVRRLLADKKSRQFVEEFTNQWLNVAKVKTVNINRDLFPRFLYLVHVGERAGTEVMFRPTIRDYLYEETIGFIGELIERNASVLNVVDSDFAYLNEPVAAHYGVAGVKGLSFRPVALRPDHRLGGTMAHASILIANSTGSAPHPIYRAVWLREAILGEEVKPPPAEVPALVDSAGASAEKAVTIKDLLAKHRTVESCNDCHSRLDPWGIPFEHYSAIGRFQPLVPREGVRVRGFNRALDRDLAGYRKYLEGVNTVKVDASARVPHGPNINGMDELKAYLLASRKDDIGKNALRRLLTYGLGRDLTYRDRFAVEQLLAQARDNDYKLKDMIVAICQSELFRGATPKSK